jgi:hypothetical protein
LGLWNKHGISVDFPELIWDKHVIPMASDGGFAEIEIL